MGIFAVMDREHGHQVWARFVDRMVMRSRLIVDSFLAGVRAAKRRRVAGGAPTATGLR
jgi:hypothetical protein